MIDNAERASLIEQAERLEEEALRLRAQANSTVCQKCGKEFPRGFGSERIASAVYCSESCQKAAKSKRQRDRKRAAKAKAAL